MRGCSEILVQGNYGPRAIVIVVVDDLGSTNRGGIEPVHSNYVVVLDVCVNSLALELATRNVRRVGILK